MSSCVEEEAAECQIIKIVIIIIITINKTTHALNYAIKKEVFEETCETALDSWWLFAFFFLSLFFFKLIRLVHIFSSR